MDDERETYRTAARLRKALKIYRLWEADPMHKRPTAEQVLNSTNDWRRYAEKTAGVPVCSDSTWLLVAVLFEEA